MAIVGTALCEVTTREDVAMLGVLGLDPLRNLVEVPCASNSIDPGLETRRNLGGGGGGAVGLPGEVALAAESRLLCRRGECNRSSSLRKPLNRFLSTTLPRLTDGRKGIINWC